METTDVDNHHGNTNVPYIRPNAATTKTKEVIQTENRESIVSFWSRVSNQVH